MGGHFLHIDAPVPSPPSNFHIDSLAPVRVHDAPTQQNPTNSDINTMHKLLFMAALAPALLASAMHIKRDGPGNQDLSMDPNVYINCHAQWGREKGKRSRCAEA